MSWTTITFPFGSILTSAKMTNLYSNFTALANGDSGAPSVQAAAIRDFTSASNAYVIASSSCTHTDTFATWVKGIEFIMPRGGTISTRLKALFVDDAGGAASGDLRIYVNGVATGTTRTATTTEQTWDEDITVSKGDLLQVYGFIGTSGAADEINITCYLFDDDPLVVPAILQGTGI